VPHDAPAIQPPVLIRAGKVIELRRRAIPYSATTQGKVRAQRTQAEKKHQQAQIA
jgi:hypothetical protein